MKKIFLCTIAILFAIASFAQASFGIKASLNDANQRLHASGNGLSAGNSGSSIISFQVGGFADIPISRNFNFNPELLLSGEGANFNDNVGGETLKPRLYYLRIPLNFLYETPIPRTESKFFIGAGPDFGFGLFGKTNAGGMQTNSFQDSLFKRFDFGLNFIGGIEVGSGFRFSINYNLGLSSIIGSIFSDALIAQTGGEVSSFQWKNNVLSFSIGYVINKDRREK